MNYKNFESTEEIDRYIEEENRTAVISILTSSCYRDKNFSTGEFDAAMEYTTDEKHYHELFEPLKERPPMYSPRVQQRDETLVEDDYAACITYLQLNFCQERIDDLKCLGRYLFPVQKKVEPQAQPKSQPKAPASTPPRANSKNPLILLAAGIAGVAAILAVILLFKKLL